MIILPLYQLYLNRAEGDEKKTIQFRFGIFPSCHTVQLRWSIKAKQLKKKKKERAARKEGTFQLNAVQPASATRVRGKLSPLLQAVASRNKELMRPKEGLHHREVLQRGTRTQLFWGQRWERKAHCRDHPLTALQDGHWAFLQRKEHGSSCGDKSPSLPQEPNRGQGISWAFEVRANTSHFGWKSHLWRATGWRRVMSKFVDISCAEASGRSVPVNGRMRS